VLDRKNAMPVNTGEDSIGGGRPSVDRVAHRQSTAGIEGRSRVLNYGAPPRPQNRRARTSRFPLWAFLLTGYFSAGRGFAYLGVSPLFISELYLGWSVLRNRHNWLGRFIDDVLRFELINVAIAVNLLWGIVEVVRCMYMNRNPIEVLRIFALNYYPLYLLVGVSLGQDLSIAQFVRVVKIMMCLYVPYAIASNAGIRLNIDIGYPGLAPVLPVAMAAIWPYLRGWRWRYVILLGTLYPLFFVVGHGRGGMLGLLLGMAVVAIVSKARIGRMLAIAAGVIVVGLIIGPYIPGPAGQSPPLDPYVYAARLVATFDPHKAEKMLDDRGYHDEAAIIGSNEGTAKWRQQIWTNAIHSLNTTELMLIGQGGGYSMVDLVPDKQDIHTPHNFAVFCLYYTGVIGLVCYCMILIAIFVSGQKIADPVLRTLVPGVLVATLLIASTGDCFETPYGAVPFYLFTGAIFGVARASQKMVMRSPTGIRSRFAPAVERIRGRNYSQSLG
jgi:hypothetical protein